MMKINFISVIGLICIILLASLPLSTSALTTFGKTNPQNQNPPPPPTPAMDAVTSRTAFEFGRLTSAGRSGVRPGMKTGGLGHSFGKARECKIESDCNAIQNTSCMADPRDGKARCLCGDYSAPINGLCANKYKAVHAACNGDDECGEGARCIDNNQAIEGKRCQCIEGYYEDNYRCNGSLSLLLANPLIIVLSFGLMILQTITYS